MKLQPKWYSATDPLIMHQEELQKAIQLLEKAEHIALVLPRDSTSDLAASAEVIVRTLSKKGKRVGFLTPPTINQIPHPESYEELQKRGLLLKEFIISLDTSHTPASQLRYEAGNEKIDVIISPKTHAISPDAVSFREGKILCDCVIALGIADLELFDTPDAIPSSLFTETSIINLDVNAQNKNFGEVNIVLSEKVSLSELAYEFLVALYNEPLDADASTLLLSGIIDQTEGFASADMGADTLLTASELTRLGARHHDAFALATPQKPFGFIQLFGRAAVRSKVSNEYQVVWSFLTPEDFEKTGRSSSDIPQIITRLKKEFTGEKLCVLLWQDRGEKTIAGIMAGAPPLLESIHKELGGELSGSSLAIANSYVSFREAEEHIGDCLKKTIRSEIA